MVDKNEQDSKRSLIGWLIIGFLIIAIVILTFVFRKNSFVDSASKYLDKKELTVENTLLIEAQDLEDDGYNTGLDDNCIGESYVEVKKDKDGNLEYTENIICDDTNPTIELNGDKKITININNEYKELGATAKIKDKDISDRIKIDSSTLDTTKVGTYEVKYTIEDRYKNTASVSRTIEVVDNIAPSITLYGGSVVSVYLGSSYVEAGFNAYDNVDGNIRKFVNVSGYVNTNSIGTYKLTYSVSDNAGNSTSVTRTVNVTDIPAPTLTLTGGNVIYHTVNTAFVEPGFTALDTVLGDITANVTFSGNVDSTKLGTYTITYRVVGSLEKEVTVTRTVYVIDNVKPVITLKGNSIVDLCLGLDVYTEEGFIVTDNYDATPLVSIENPVDNNVSGTYVITYTATDSSGNKTVVTRTVNIKTLESIEVTTPATKTSYVSGEPLDITGLVVTGTLSDNSTIILPITVSNITGFDSSMAVESKTLTITFLGKTTTYDISVVMGLQELAVRENIDEDPNDYTTAYSDAGLSFDTATEGTLKVLVPNSLTNVSDILREGGNPLSTTAFVGIVFTTPDIDGITQVDVSINGSPFTGTLLDLSGPNGNNLLNNQYIEYFRFADEIEGEWTPAPNATYNIILRWYDSSNNLIAETSGTVIREKQLLDYK